MKMTALYNGKEENLFFKGTQYEIDVSQEQTFQSIIVRMNGIIQFQYSEFEDFLQAWPELKVID
jgi:DNA polymerase III sliding clamp (beta) subunit (PCNA family)